MSDFDHEHVSHLLNIVAQCAGHSGKLGSISNAAMAELLELNAKIKAQAVEAQKERERQEGLDRAAAQADVEPVVEPEPEVDDDGVLRPTVYPSDSETATIADRRL